MAAIAWLALDRNRLLAIWPLAVAWVAGALVAGLALLLPGVSDNGQSHNARLQDGIAFGILVVLGAIAVVFAFRAVASRSVSRTVARRVAAGLAGFVVLALLVAVAHAGGPADFARAVRRLVEDEPLRARLGAAARLSVQDRSWPIAFQKFWAATAFA